MIDYTRMNLSENLSTLSGLRELRSRIAQKGSIHFYENNMAIYKLYLVYTRIRFLLVIDYLAFY